MDPKLDAVEDHLIQAMQGLTEIERDQRSGTLAYRLLGLTYLSLAKAHGRLLNAQKAMLGEPLNAPSLSDLLKGDTL